MGLWSRLFGAEKRDHASAVDGLADPYVAPYLPLLPGGGLGTGYTSPEAAVSTLAVAARCVSLISGALAAVPLPVYARRDDGGRVGSPGQALHRILNDVANPGMSAFELRELLFRDLAMYGNAFARIVLDGAGRVQELHYLPSRMVGVERLASGRLRYRYSDQWRGNLVLLQEEVAHLRYASRDGILGLSPLAWARGAIGLAMQQSELAEAQASRGNIPDMVFETDTAFSGDMADTAFNRLKRQLSERMGRMNRGAEALLLEGGLKARAIATPGRDAQFYEARVLGLEDVARVYGVPLSVVGLGRNASYGSLEQEARALVQNCYIPWARRGEAQLMLALLSAEGRRSFVIEHDLSDLLRGDMLARLQAYKLGIEAEIWSPNEIRIWEGQNPREGGDTYRNPAISQAAPP